MKTISILSAPFILGIPMGASADVAFTAKPRVEKAGDGLKITFAVSEPTDVEVAVLAGTNVVRHLAAGVLGGTNAPPEPLKPGLAQELVWDGRDDFGRNVSGVKGQGADSSAAKSGVTVQTEGGTMPGTRSAAFANKMEGVLHAYPGLAPYSSAAEAFGGNSCCVCRAPRFDLDRYGRLALPNAITSSVLLYDNAGNLIAEFGKYGNFDSQYVNFNTEAGKAGKPTLAVPEVPLAWPTGAGFSENHIYVNDTQHRRMVRLDPTWKAEIVADVN